MSAHRNQMETLLLKAADAAHPDEAGFRARFEKSLARKLSADWKVAAAPAVAAGVAAFRRAGQTPTAPEKVAAAVANAVRGFPDKVDKTVTAQTGIFYRGAQSRFLRDFEAEQHVRKDGSGEAPAGGSVSTGGTISTGALAGGGKLYPEVYGERRRRFVRKAKVASGTVDFGLRDQKAIDALSELTVNAASLYFPEQLRSKVADVVKDVVLEKGLSVEDAAKKLGEEIAGALGVGGVAEAVAPRFETNPEAYFRILAGQASTLASSVGRILSMDEAGVEKFEIAAVIDKRTSAICRSLNGKVVQVGSAVRTVDRLLDFTGVRQVETLLPFTASGAESAPTWASSVGFPPYHHGPCRTQVIPIVE